MRIHTYTLKSIPIHSKWTLLTFFAKKSRKWRKGRKGEKKGRVRKACINLLCSYYMCYRVVLCIVMPVSSPYDTLSCLPGCLRKVPSVRLFLFHLVCVKEGAYRCYWLLCVFDEVLSVYDAYCKHSLCCEYGLVEYPVWLFCLFGFGLELSL